jgi:Tetraacyldisaccharide-1-P 4'-kinase
VREPAFWHRPSSWISLLLTPFAAVYGLVAAARLQRRGVDAGVPVLCVGNYHTGGAGKTPTVRALANMLRDLGETPVVRRLSCHPFGCCFYANGAKPRHPRLCYKRSWRNPESRSWYHPAPSPSW